MTTMTTRMKATEGMRATKSVNARGETYRWNFDHDELQIVRGDHWEKSAFTTFVRQAMRGEPITGLPTDVVSAQHIADVIVPEIKKNQPK